MLVVMLVLMLVVMLVLCQVDAKTAANIIRVEQCEKYIPIFTHNDAYAPLSVPLSEYGIK